MPCSLARVVSQNRTSPARSLPKQRLVEPRQDHHQHRTSPPPHPLPLWPNSMSAIRPGNLKVPLNRCSGWTQSTFLIFLFDVSAVAGCFRHFLITLGRRGTAAKIGGVGVGFSGRGRHAKAGGLFPRNGKEAVWKAETLQDTHGRFVLHERPEWTFCSSGEACVHGRGHGLPLAGDTHIMHTHLGREKPNSPTQPCCDTAKRSR